MSIVLSSSSYRMVSRSRDFSSKAPTHSRSAACSSSTRGDSAWYSTSISKVASAKITGCAILPLVESNHHSAGNRQHPWQKWPRAVVITETARGFQGDLLHQILRIMSPSHCCGDKRKHPWLSLHPKLGESLLFVWGRGTRNHFFVSAILLQYFVPFANQ